MVGRYLEHVNVLHLLLDSAVLKIKNLGFFDFSEVTRKDAFRMHFGGSGPGGFHIQDQSLAAVYQLGRFSPSFYLNGDPRQDPRIFHRRELPKEVFDRLAEDFHTTVSDAPLIGRLANLARGLSEYKVGSYGTSIVLSWFVIEEIITQRWKAFLDSKKTGFENGKSRLNSDRRERLEGRDYPVSVVSNLLELSDSLDFSVFECIDQVRKCRNAIVHRDPKHVCNHEHGEKALQLAADLCIETHSPFSSAELLLSNRWALS